MARKAISLAAFNERHTAILSDRDKREIANELKLRGIKVGTVVTQSAAEQMTPDELNTDLIATCGRAICPACGIHLSNGLSHFDELEEQLGSRAALRQQQHEWACSCGAQWGKTISTKATNVTTSSKASSSVGGAVAMVWALCSEMPDAGRKAVVDAAVLKGVNANTARTQYQRWSQANKVK